MFIQQRCHILPCLVGQGLQTKRDIASLLFSCRFPDLFSTFRRGCVTSQRVAGPIARATRCDTSHLQWCFPRVLGKLHAICYNRKFNMLNIMVAMLEYLRYLLSDFQTVFSIMMDI